MRLNFTLFVLIGSFCSAGAAWCAPALERGMAITDPAGLRELDRGKLGLRRILAHASSVGSPDTPLTNSQLFALPSMMPVRRAINREFESYIAKHQSSLAHENLAHENLAHENLVNENLAGETIGIGNAFDFQLFDRQWLDSPDTRFVLSGVVNRMDRAYVAQAGCGEIRLIYRLTQTSAPDVGDQSASPRLPMTLNVVLKAKGAGSSNKALTCSDIARRWLALAETDLTAGKELAGSQIAERLLSKEGPLNGVIPENIERIETNLQIAHAPKSAVRDFRTDYLLKVFDYNAQTKTFDEAPLENQIDRDRILADADLRRDFRAWLLDPVHFSELDRGTVLIPPKFLATGAIAPTPVGFAPSNLLPAFGLVENDEATENPVFSRSDVVSALKKADDSGVILRNVRSVAGFERRLDDVTCAGCHQTRGIGGFHFPGVDWMAARPSNSTVVPASPHFFGDQVRRRDILTAMRDGKRPDYSRGFSSRPQSRGSTELAGTEYADGWGAHCYIPDARVTDNDKSFTSWTCANGLSCQAVGGTAINKASRMGMCFVKNP